MTDTKKEQETTPEEENQEVMEQAETGEQEVVEKKAVVPQVAKPHNKFAQYGTKGNFGGGNKFGNASGKRMGRAAQRGR